MNQYFILDISSHNDIVDYDLMAQNVDGVMIRGSLGYKNNNEVYCLDKAMKKHVQELSKRGVKLGLYHYSYADRIGAGKAEAIGFIKVLKELEKEGYRFELPVALDMEDNCDGGVSDHGSLANNWKGLATVCFEFLEHVEQQGYYVMLYASKSWISQLHLANPELKRFAIWLAEWDRSTPSISCALWQYGVLSRGPELGQRYVANYPASARIDCNLTGTDFPTLIRSRGLNGLTSKFLGEQKTIVVKEGKFYLLDEKGAVLGNTTIQVKEDGELLL